MSMGRYYTIWRGFAAGAGCFMNLKTPLFAVALLFSLSAGALGDDFSDAGGLLGEAISGSRSGGGNSGINPGIGAVPVYGKSAHPGPEPRDDLKGVVI